MTARTAKGTWGGRRPGAGRKPQLEDAVRYSLDLERSQLDALNAIAADRDLSVAAVVREAVWLYIARKGRR